MPKEDLIVKWTGAGGKVFEFEQPEEFCQAMCSIWISLRQQNVSGGELLARFHGQTMQESCRNLQSVLEAKKTLKIAGLTKHKVGGNSIGGIGKVLDKIMVDRGLYLLRISTGGTRIGPGHAIAFDTTPPSLYFMDPNFGQVWFDNYAPVGGQFFRDWFREYWTDEGWIDAQDEFGEEAISYKDLYPGARKLRRFD
jgi:hypothetical protein